MFFRIFTNTPFSRHQIRYSMRHLSLIFTALFLTACEGKTGFSSYSNYDLKSEAEECRANPNGLSPGGAQRCSNIERECAKRKAESGFRC